MSDPPVTNRDSWGGWITSKVATAEAAFSTALVPEQPTRSQSFHNLRAVAKANRLAALRQHPATQPRGHHVVVDVGNSDREEEDVLPPLTRRASAIDMTLSHAWHAVRSAAVAAMATFDEPVQTVQPLRAALPSCKDALPTQLPTMPENIHCANTEIGNVTIQTQQQPTISEKMLDANTEISDVTISASCSSADFSDYILPSSTPRASLDNPCSNVCEHPRISTTSCNHHVNTEHIVLKEVFKVSDSDSSVVENHELDHHEPNREDDHEVSPDISPEQLKQLLDDFNTMFEHNGGAECVARVKQIGDMSLEAMREPQTLNEAVENELNEAKLKLDNTLQRLECAVRSKQTEVHSENCDAFDAAEAVIEETKENSGSMDSMKRNGTLLQDCTRLLAVFASKICACVLDRVESDKEERTWNERVDEIGRVSARGIPQVRIIARRFVVAVEGHGKNMVGKDEARDFVGRIYKVADAGVEQVVQCVALAVAALQVEVSDRAYECCG